jgi:acyl-coenzyme A synthetase/AMP-(fatty) acid ligase
MSESNTNRLPILDRDLSSAFALHSGRVISAGEFITQAVGWSQQLPDKSHSINLCGDRYLFAVAFMAAALRGQCNLLIPGSPAGTIEETLSAFPDAYILHDGDVDIRGAESRLIQHRLDFEKIATETLTINAQQQVALVFTSGSTGISKPVVKNWRTLWSGALINRNYLLGDSQSSTGMVATVPPWHMYGLEWSIMLPLISDVLIYAGSAFFPDDVRTALKRLTGERCLVTTPLHLRALLKSNLNFPRVTRILCATTPLDPILALEAQELFDGTLLEIYGCSEAGSMAHRYPADDHAWRFFEEFHVEKLASKVRVTSDHLPNPIDLPDVIEFDEQGGFILNGRDSDLIKIAGKRASLADLNSRLLAIKGVEDGAIFSLQERGNEVSRLSALVVSKELTPGQIRRELSLLIDPVFLPRPLRIVDRLPRTDLGKLRSQDLLKFVSSEKRSI